jgi:16S rRNA (cytosine967-C5)-methyltransferase
MSNSSRSIAVDVLERVTFDDAYSHIALSAALDKSDLDERDRGLTTELVYGTLTRQRTLDEVLSKFVNRSLHKLDRPVLLNLRLAAYQLLFLDRIPDHAVGDEAVEMTKRRCSRGASGFVNGVLRSMLRGRRKWNVWDHISAEKDPSRHLGLRHSLPDWLATRLIEAHGFPRAMDMAKAFNARPPHYFRALSELSNRSVDDLENVEQVPGALRGSQMSDATRNLVEQSQLVVQDLGSQLVGHFAGPRQATSVLDACAGLGGKTLHLASLATDASLTAVEPQRSKLEHLDESASRLGISDRISTFCGTLEGLPEEVGPFDLVLVDAPCTGLGVIRRHPETRWRRNADDIADRAALQRTLLKQAARRVAPGGMLVYSVCTFTAEEGPAQIARFLDEHPHFQRENPPELDDLDWSTYTNELGELVLNPLDHDSDAFFAARLRHHRE